MTFLRNGRRRRTTVQEAESYIIIITSKDNITSVRRWSDRFVCMYKYIIIRKGVNNTYNNNNTRRGCLVPTYIRIDETIRPPKTREQTICQ